MLYSDGSWSLWALLALGWLLLGVLAMIKALHKAWKFRELDSKDAEEDSIWEVTVRYLLIVLCGPLAVLRYFVLKTKEDLEDEEDLRELRKESEAYS